MRRSRAAGLAAAPAIRTRTAFQPTVLRPLRLARSIPKIAPSAETGRRGRAVSPRPTRKGNLGLRASDSFPPIQSLTICRPSSKMGVFGSNSKEVERGGTVQRRVTTHL